MSDVLGLASGLDVSSFLSSLECACGFGASIRTKDWYSTTGEKRRLFSYSLFLICT